MKKLTYNLSLYIIPVVITLIIFWFSSSENFQQISEDYSKLLETLFYLSLFILLTLSIIRALIGTIKLAVGKLSFFETKRERLEDGEFRIIIETLVLVISILIAVIVAISNQYILSINHTKITDQVDLILNIVSIIFAALINYSRPLLKQKMQKQK